MNSSETDGRAPFYMDPMTQNWENNPNLLSKNTLYYPKGKGPRQEALIVGAAGRNWTHDPLVRSQVLYPTELQPLSFKL